MVDFCCFHQRFVLQITLFFLVHAFTRYLFCVNDFSCFNLLVLLLKENLMETSYTELEGLEGAVYQDPKISESFADPLFWAVLCIYISILNTDNLGFFQITIADYV